MTTIQPAIMSTSVGRSASGWRTRATMTGGAHDRKGPKKGIACSTPAVTDVSAARGRPSSRFVASAIRK